MPAAINLKKQTFTSRKFESVIREAMRFMMASPIHPFPPAERFAGAGVYALYYCGDFEHYRHIAMANQQDAKTPVYVGKAVPPGWRIGRTGYVGRNTGPLYRRLAEHVGTVEQVENLDVGDFCCRFMILGGTESDLISACEAQSIRKFAPLWNTAVDGFGNHTPGKGRFGQAKSEWDVLHPGRAWADRCRGVPPLLENIIGKICEHRND